MCYSRKPKGAALTNWRASQLPLTTQAAGGPLCTEKTGKHNQHLIEADTESDAISFKCPRRTTALNKDKATQPSLASLGSLGREGCH